MARVPIFTGRVTDEADLVLAENEKLQRRLHLRTLAGKDVEIIIRRKREQRSLNMNAYLHAEVFPAFAREWCDSIEGVKFDLMGECWGWTTTKQGHHIPVKPHTSDMSVEESTFFVDWVVPFGAQRGVDVPLPREAEA